MLFEEFFLPRRGALPPYLTALMSDAEEKV
jgi:hypothetical protein